MVQTVDIIEELLQNLNTDLVVSSVMDLGNNTYKLTTCNTQYLNTLYKFTLLQGVEAKVTAFEFNKSVTIKVENYTPEAITYVLPKPRYDHGTIRAVNEERNEIPYSEGKYPYIYLLERMREGFFRDPETRLDRNSPLKMFFLTNYKTEGNWQTDEHYAEIIEPMSNVRENFLILLEGSSLVNDETFKTGVDRETWFGDNYVKFGTYREDSGNIKSLMDEDVSGVGLEINVIFNKNLKCKPNGCL